MQPGATDLPGFTQAQLATQSAARAFATEHLAPHAQRYDREGGFPRETLQAFARAGLMGVNIPKAYGGQEAGVVAYALAVRELAAACAGTTVGMMVTNMVAEAIALYGSDDQKTRWIPRIMSGEWAAAGFSLSEPGAGSDAGGLKTTATRDGEHYILEGTKSWVTSGGEAGLYLIMAITDASAGSRGISAFLVPADAPGLTATKPEEKMGQHASPTTELVLQSCRVPVADRLGPEGIGFKVAMTSLDGGRVGVSAQACGVATAAFTQLQALGDKQGIDGLEALIADSAVELEAGWLMCLRAARLKDAKARLTREAAMAKMYCTEMASRVTERAMQAHGRAGFTAPAEKLMRDVRITRIYEGTNQIQRLVVAREVIKGFK
jgi:hypothetical protein